MHDYAMDGSYGRGGALPHHRHILPAIKGLLPSGRLRILDVGCGNGYVDNALASLGHEVVGIDFDPKALDIHRRVYPSLQVFQHGAEDRFSTFMAGADVVVASEVVEHLYSPKKFLQNVYETLRPGGHVILTTPFHGYLKNLAISLVGGWDHVFTAGWEEGHIKFFSNATMKQMLREVGFEDIAFRNAGRLPWLWKTLVAHARKGERPG